MSSPPLAPWICTPSVPPPTCCASPPGATSSLWTRSACERRSVTRDRPGSGTRNGGRRGFGQQGHNVLNGACDPRGEELGYGGPGTHGAGILGAVTNNGSGGAGLNWNASLLAVKWLDAQANGATSDLIRALDWL